MPQDYYKSGNQLPGPNLPNRNVSHFRKSQHFQVVSDAPGFIQRMVPGKASIGGSPLRYEREDEWAFGEKSGGERVITEGQRPKWISRDKQILRFWSYAQESVVEQGMGRFIQRRFVILYFLEDDTIKIVEISPSNDGFPQGTFLRRHRIPFEDENVNSRLKPHDQFINFWDFNLGDRIRIYGRDHTIVNCDPFTRSFLDTSGITVKGSVSEPQHFFKASS